MFDIGKLKTLFGNMRVALKARASYLIGHGQLW